MWLNTTVYIHVFVKTLLGRKAFHRDTFWADVGLLIFWGVMVPNVQFESFLGYTFAALHTAGHPVLSDMPAHFNLGWESLFTLFAGKFCLVFRSVCPLLVVFVLTRGENFSAIATLHFLQIFFMFLLEVLQFDCLVVLQNFRTVPALDIDHPIVSSFTMFKILSPALELYLTRTFGTIF